MNKRVTRILRFGAIAAALVAGAACGAENGEADIDVAAISGERLVVELGGPAVSLSALPEGVVVAADRLEWTPAAEHEGEHLLALAILRDGSAEPVTVRVTVASVDPAIEYGGCECGSKPQPPRPRAEALGVVFLVAYCGKRRRAAVAAENGGS